MTGEGIVKPARMNASVLRALFLLALLADLALPSSAQVAQPKTTEQGTTPFWGERAAAGDAPDAPGPLATDLSPALTHAAISKAAQQVADWKVGEAVAWAISPRGRHGAGSVLHGFAF